MASPPQGQMRPGRQLAVLGVIFVVLYTLVFFAGASGSWKERLEPRLGLDLVGGTRMTLQATNSLDGQPPTPENLEEARRIIDNRVNALGVAEAEVVTEGDRNIVISLPGENRDLSEVGTAAELRFRKVLKVADGSGVSLTQPQPQPTPEPGGDADAEDPQAPASPEASASPQASENPGGQGGAAPSATPSADPSPSAATGGDATIEQQLIAVREKVGKEAWDAANGLQAPADLSTQPDLAEALEPFGTLTGREVAVLPANIQFNVPFISCEQLSDRPAASVKDPAAQVVACESTAKYLLDVAKVEGTDVSNATAQIDQTSQWVVSLNFTSDGQKKWTELTREAYNNPDNACDPAALGDEGRCLVAVVLDNDVISAPQILSVLTGDSQISGNFNATTANELAGQLRYGALPLTFEEQATENVSATLGASHLKAGLIAAGIGMLLVIIYAFFYYRLLGSVIFLSLILSGLLVFGALVVLGRQIGFTLTLAGFAGFIVSLGVAADSFVIYFERLKDEIRDGRNPRSAVGRAWQRARRTIISANAVTILAAVVLYVVSVGTVKGFAFALGLATVLDLVVVFLFRHPMMTMLARTKAFLSPRVSGLGRVLHTAEAPTPVTNTPVKEA